MRKRVTSPVPQSTETPDPEWLDLEQIAQVEVTFRGRRVSDRIRAGARRGVRVAGRAARRADGPAHLRPAAAPEPDVAALHRGGCHAHAGVRAALVAGRRAIVPRDPPPAVEFGPPDTIREAEDYRVELVGVTVLELEIVPDKSGGEARASLAQWRLAA